MTDNQTKIKELVALGDKATYNVLGVVPTDVLDELMDESTTAYSFKGTQGDCKDNAKFIEAFYKARPAIKAMLADNERLREACMEALNFLAIGYLHPDEDGSPEYKKGHHVYMKLKQALTTTEEE